MTRIYTITSPEQNYSGDGIGGITFTNSVATTNSYYIAGLYSKKGYEVTVEKIQEELNAIVFNLKTVDQQSLINSNKITLNVANIESIGRFTSLGNAVIDIYAHTTTAPVTKGNIIIKDIDIEEDSQLIVQCMLGMANANNTFVKIYNVEDIDMANVVKQIAMDRVSSGKLYYLEDGGFTYLEERVFNKTETIKLPKGKYNFAIEFNRDTSLPKWYLRGYLIDFMVIKK